MNEFEAQLKVTQLIKDVLTSLSEAPLSQEEQDSMGDVADMVVEALGLTVVSVEGSTATLTVDLSDPE